MKSNSWPVLGCGVGLRSQHYPVITETWPRMDWFEAISENYMDTGGRPLRILEEVRHHYPVALHGTALSIGSSDPLNKNYLERLKKLADRIDPFIVSDHLCWSSVSGEQLHDLLPLPLTEEAIQHVIRRVESVQEFLGRKILLENISTYVTYRHSIIPEWEFLTQVAKRSGCGILLDLNNIYVNAANHKFDPYDYLKNVPGELIGQIHLAGHTDMGSFLFDTHSAPVIDRVWDLYREALHLWGPISTLVEWDEHIPPFKQLAQEAGKAKEIYRQFENRQTVIASAMFETLSRNEGLDTGPLLLEVERWVKSRVQPQSRSKEPPAPVFSQTLLNPQGGASGEERMAVYANGYLARIRESLKEVYETVYHLLGENDFTVLSHAYAEAYHSSDYNLNFAGRHLAEFLHVILRPETAGRSGEESQNGILRFAQDDKALLDAFKPFPFLIDLVKLEWLIWEAFHAFDQKPLSPGQMAQASPEDWENARIIFQPSVGLVSSSWPILDIWRRRRTEAGTDSAAGQVLRNSIDLNTCPDQNRYRVLVSRKRNQVQCEFVDEIQYKLLEGFLAGRSLGAVCEELTDATDDQISSISTWFSSWVRGGLIVRCEFSEKTAIQPCSR